MKYSIRLFSFLIILLFSITAFGQKENYRPAKITKTDGTTLKGFIDYQNWRKNPKEITFKKTEEGDATLYYPLTLASFEVEGDKFVSKKVSYEISLNQLEQLEYSTSLIFNTNTHFLQVLFEGKKELYYLRDNIGKEHFFIPKNDTLDVLLFHRYLKKVKDKNTGKTKSVVRENKTYLKQLINYLNDCDEIGVQFQSLKYTRKGIIELFKSYYDCVGEEILYQTKKNKVSRSFGVIGGMSATKFTVKPTSIYVSGFDYLLPEHKLSNNLFAGLSFNMTFPKSNGRRSLQNELLLTNFLVEGSYEQQTSSTIFEEIDFTFGLNQIKLNNLFRSEFFKKDTRASYYNVGVSNSFIVGGKNSRETTTYFHQDVSTQYFSALGGISIHQLGLIGGIGYSDGRFSSEIRYEYGTDLTRILSLDAHTHRFFVLVGYSLNKKIKNIH